MPKYNIPMNSLSVRFQKEQRVIKQLTHKDALADALVSLYNNAMNQHSNQDCNNKFIELYKPVYQELSKSKLSLKDFQMLHKDSFAEGAFGKVTIVKSTRNNQIYAMKTSNKSKLIDQIDRSSPMEERLILTNENEEWLPSLYASFQDEKNLYLVMEYATGGDLQGLIERRSFQPFSEQEARFYCAELILAVERVHQLGYMHRDIKPGNILIDNKGHIKLGDLGSCISLDAKEYLLMVGTMPYVSPEMCNSEGFDSSNGAVAYGSEVDWWSMGIILYELLYGERPFTGSDIKIQMSLLNPKVSVQFDANIKVSDEAKDLLSKLLCKSKDKRLGCHGAAEIKSHPFFKGINWSLLRTTAVPPFIPSIVSPDDVTFFSATSNENGNHEQDVDDDEHSFVITEHDEQTDALVKEYPFIGYTYSSFNNTASTIAKPARSSSNQEFIAQYRQRLSSPEPRQWEEEKLKLKVAHEKDLEQLKLEQAEEIKALQQTLAELQDRNTRSEQLIQSLKDENGQLKSSLVDIRDSKAQQAQTLSIVQTLQDQSSEMQKEHDKLNSTIKSQEHELEQLQATIQELRTENKQLVKFKQENSDSAQLREDSSQQQAKLLGLRKELDLLTDKLSTCEKQAVEYRNHISKLETCQQSNDKYQLTIQEFQLEIKELEDKAQKEANYSQKIEQQYSQKLIDQASGYDNLIEQLKKECDHLKQELSEKRSAESAAAAEMKMNRSSKSLPAIPITATSEPASAMDSPGEGRSILASMWQRERDSLKSVQQALEHSESQLAYAKMEVVRLKREVKCFQKYTFQQQQQHGFTSVDLDDRNNDTSLPKNQSDNSKLYNHQRKTLPSNHNNIDWTPSDFSEKPDDGYSLRISGKMKKTNSSIENNQKQDQALLRKIEQEKSFIKSTERTIAARARLSRNEGAIGKELEASLKRARFTLASLESSLSPNRYYSPSDFFASQKPFSSTVDGLSND